MVKNFTPQEVSDCMKRDDIQCAKALSMDDVQYVVMDDVQSTGMMTYLINTHVHIFLGQNLVKVFQAKQRDYIMSILIDKGYITSDNLLSHMLYGEEGDEVDQTLMNSITDNGDKDAMLHALDTLHTEYIKYLGELYKNMMGYYPTLNDIRRTIKRVDIVLSLWDGKEINNEKKRKL